MDDSTVPPVSRPPRRRRRHWPVWVKFTVGLTVALLPFLLAEGAMRLLVALRPAAAEKQTWYVYDTQLGWRLRPNYHEKPFDIVMRHVDADSFRPSDALKLKNKDRKRIVVLSDSTGYGFMVPDPEAYPDLLDGLLPDYDVINLSVPGYSSYQGLLALQSRALPLDPDVLIVSFNFNDRRYQLDPAMIDGPQEFARLGRMQRWENLRRFSCLYRFLTAQASRRRGSFGVAPASMDMFHNQSTIPSVDVRSLVPRVSLEDYRRNLDQIARLAAEHGVRVIFLLEGDNPAQTQDLNQGLELLEQGQDEAGLALLKEVSGQAHWLSTLARLEWTLSLERLGRSGEANQAAQLPNPVNAITGHHPIRLESPYQQVMREVAAAHDCTLVDVATPLASHPDYFMDHCHVYAPGHQLIAQALAACFEDEQSSPTAH